MNYASILGLLADAVSGSSGIYPAYDEDIGRMSNLNLINPCELNSKHFVCFQVWSPQQLGRSTDKWLADRKYIDRTLGAAPTGVLRRIEPSLL